MCKFLFRNYLFTLSKFFYYLELITEHFMLARQGIDSQREASAQE